MVVLTKIIIILLVAALVYAVYFALQWVSSRHPRQSGNLRKILPYIMAGLVIWLSLLATLSKVGFFQNFSVLPPRVLVAIVPPTLLIIYLMFAREFRVTILRHIPRQWLIYIQAFRIVVELTLWLGLIGGFVPFQMTFEGLNFDFVVGLTALIAGKMFFGRMGYRKFEVFIWNIFGIALLVNIVTISLLSAPSPYRVFMNEPANTFIAHFPYIWIPGFIVPFALAMHLFSIKQIFIVGKKRQQRR